MTQADVPELVPENRPAGWVRLERAPRRLNLPWWAVLIFAGWAALVGTGVALGGLAEGEVQLCAMKNVAGVPCVACRGTRATVSLARADLLAALRFNPLVTVALIAAVSWAVLRFGFGRAVRFALPTGAKVAIGVGVPVIVMLNWAYVIWAGG